jgi:hypothetical protein
MISCSAGTWGHYSTRDRDRAHANGLPYWEDIFMVCYPPTLGSTTIDRLAWPRIMHKLAPPIVVYYTSDSMIKLDPKNPPDEFAGFMAHVDYFSDNGSDDTSFLVTWLMYSKYAAKEKQEEIDNKAIEKEELNVGDFTYFKVKWEIGDFGFAFYDDYICIGTVLADGFDGTRNQLFETLLSQIDVECIKSQCP